VPPKVLRAAPRRRVARPEAVRRHGAQSPIAFRRSCLILALPKRYAGAGGEKTPVPSFVLQFRQLSRLRDYFPMPGMVIFFFFFFSARFVLP